MISLLRLDDRLVHGQVAVVWSQYLQIDAIVVANEKVANDPVQQMATKMAVSKDIKLAILKPEDAVNLLNNPKAEKMKILVVVDNVDDALTIAENVEGVKKINIGNYGQQQRKPGKRALTREVFVEDSDVELFRKAIDKGFELEVQLTPNDTPVNIKNLI